MKKINTLLLLVATIMGLSLTSCDDYYGPPGATYDPDLIGTWELISVNGNSVHGYQKNWLEFYRNGNGTYYYYVNGKPYEMSLSYDIDYYYNRSNLYIYYADGRSAYMNYWFNSNYTYLYMQWSEGGYLNTYVYAYVNSVDWAPARKDNDSAAPLFLPGVTLYSDLDKSLFKVNPGPDSVVNKPLEIAAK